MAGSRTALESRYGRYPCNMPPTLGPLARQRKPQTIGYFTMQSPYDHNSKSSLEDHKLKTSTLRSSLWWGFFFLTCQSPLHTVSNPSQRSLYHEYLEAALERGIKVTSRCNWKPSMDVHNGLKSGYAVASAHPPGSLLRH